MTAVQLRESQIVKAFVLFALGSIVGGFLAGAILGGLLGVIVAGVGGTLANVQSGAAVLGGLAGVVVSYFIFRTVVLKIIAPKIVAATDLTPGQRAV
jgi:hypothetical protein